MNEGNVTSLPPFLSEEGRELVNIKFFPGSDHGLTKERLEEAGLTALKSALSKGDINEPPVTGMPKHTIV